MTREEEKQQASEIYLADNVPDRCREYFGYIKLAFEAGAEWSDNNPDLSSLWHDASEIPQENYKNIIYQTNYCSMFNVHIVFIPTCLRSCKITSDSWNEFVNDVNMKKWAYVKDLLPKGGKE